MRTFGRACRGKGKVYVSLVRDTEKQVLCVGSKVVSLALSAQMHLQSDASLHPEQKGDLEDKLKEAIETHQAIEKQSRRLVNGKSLPHCKIVNAYDVTIAPIKKGKSNCATQFGKKPGIIAEMGSGFIFGLHLPQGNPDDASYVMPLIDKVDAAIDRLTWTYPRRRPSIRSLAGDLGMNDPKVREKLHNKGITTVGIPNTIEPIPKVPTPSMIQAILNTPILNENQNATQIKIAYACGYSRTFVESLINSLICRGATHIKYKGHRGAMIQIGMAIIAANATTLVRIKQDRLSKRTQKCRRWFRLKPLNYNENSDPHE